MEGTDFKGNQQSSGVGSSFLKAASIQSEWLVGMHDTIEETANTKVNNESLGDYTEKCVCKGRQYKSEPF